ncbi:Multidrug efflux pump subunit AcrA (membrane-fusion protein) [Catalinimonas alkaloidigena]|uniref:Multidrug efflux pump subunit AcrA (Membrane-fusion protein) n=1 Tax=Catalinimonas alkaloidigena TaxID=1075417 RepID=A0A1G9AAP4_9BACT|nr:efflux RND transporter periplasmic adaptor subunit [Catalinimonas alkaloidigena]SDK24367.1 Multidrug efflux pump subunit AcrA (membrane-fusion protein) [Catalinimonas alkaloidigena]
MNKNWNGKPFNWGFILWLALWLAACQPGNTHDHEGLYTCPMHPQVIQEGPGSCPVCGMDLVPQASEGDEAPLPEGIARLSEASDEAIVGRTATIRPSRMSQKATLTLEGNVVPDPRHVHTVPARVAGRIERLYVKYPYQSVRKGEKLLDVYSPELVTAQKELLYVAKQQDTQLIEAAKQKLRLLGTTDRQIDRLLQTGQPSYTVALYSPYDGYVTDLNATALPEVRPAGAGMATATGMGMGSAASQRNDGGAAPTLSLREGSYVSVGQSLFQVVDPSRLWAEFLAPAADARQVEEGMPLQLLLGNGDTLATQVDFVQPFYQRGEPFARLRVYLHDVNARVAVGQLVRGRLTYTTPEQLWVPREAVVDLGAEAVVFRRKGDAFRPVPVTTGAMINGKRAILSGLEGDEWLAANAQMLVDSESFIQVNE